MDLEARLAFNQMQNGLQLALSLKGEDMPRSDCLELVPFERGCRCSGDQPRRIHEHDLQSLVDGVLDQGLRSKDMGKEVAGRRGGTDGLHRKG